MPKLEAKDAAARASNPLGRDFSEALFRGLQIITAFGPSTQSMTLSDVARQVDLPRATVRRSLLTLAHLGYVKEEGRLFSLTPQVLQLAAAYLGASHASTILQPCCERLAAEYGDTFSVAVLDGESAVMIAYATPRRMYMDAPGIGLRLPAYCSAVGRVLLAALPDPQRESFLETVTAPGDHAPHCDGQSGVAHDSGAGRDRGVLDRRGRSRDRVPLACGAGAAGGGRRGFRLEHRDAHRAALRRSDAGNVSAAVAGGGRVVEQAVVIGLDGCTGTR